MPWKPFSFDDSVARTSSGGILHVPDGDYLLQATKIEPGPEDLAEGKEAYLWLYFRIIEGPVQGMPAGTGREIRMVSSCKPDAQGRLGQFFAAIGRTDVTDGLRKLGAQTKAAGREQFPTYADFVKVCLGLGRIAAGKNVGAELGSNSYNGRNGVITSSQIEQVYSPDEYKQRKATMGNRPPQVVGTTGPVAVTPTNGSAPPAVVPDDSGLADQLENLLASMAGESA